MRKLIKKYVAAFNGLTLKTTLSEPWTLLLQEYSATAG